MRLRKQKGFTIIELIMSVVLIGIIAGLLAPIITANMTAYVNSQDRANLLDKIRVSLGRLSRELRQATSQLTTASGSTLQFTTTTVGGKYIAFNANTPRIAISDCRKIKNQSPSQLERFLPNNPIGSLCVLYPGDLSALPASQRNALIISRDVAPISSVTQITSGSPDAYAGALWKVNFTSDYTFSSASSSEESIYNLADYKHRITLSGSNLIWQRTTASASGFSGATSGILLHGVSNFTTSINHLNGVVTVDLDITSGGESISVSEDIYVRN